MPVAYIFAAASTAIEYPKSLDDVLPNCFAQNAVPNAGMEIDIVGECKLLKEAGSGGSPGEIVVVAIQFIL